MLHVYRHEWKLFNFVNSPEKLDDSSCLYRDREASKVSVFSLPAQRPARSLDSQAQVWCLCWAHRKSATRAEKFVALDLRENFRFQTFDVIQWILNEKYSRLSLLSSMSKIMFVCPVSTSHCCSFASALSARRMQKVIIFVNCDKWHGEQLILNCINENCYD